MVHGLKSLAMGGYGTVLAQGIQIKPRPCPKTDAVLCNQAGRYVWCPSSHFSFQLANYLCLPCLAPPLLMQSFWNLFWLISNKNQTELTSPNGIATVWFPLLFTLIMRADSSWKPLAAAVSGSCASGATQSQVSSIIVSICVVMEKLPKGFLPASS